MPKQVTIVFTQIGDKVRVQSSPSFAELMQMLEGGHQPNDAEVYAMYALRMVREKSKENKKGSSIIELPKRRGGM